MGRPRWEVAGNEMGRRIYHRRWDVQDGKWQIMRWEDEFTTWHGASKKQWLKALGDVCLKTDPQKNINHGDCHQHGGIENLGHTSIWIHLTISFKYEDLSQTSYGNHTSEISNVARCLWLGHHSGDPSNHMINLGISDISHVQLIPGESEKPWYYTSNEQLADWSMDIIPKTCRPQLRAGRQTAGRQISQNREETQKNTKQVGREPKVEKCLVCVVCMHR